MVEWSLIAFLHVIRGLGIWTKWEIKYENVIGLPQFSQQQEPLKPWHVCVNEEKLKTDI